MENNNNVKDNFMDLEKTWHNWQWYAALNLRTGKVFCDSIPNVGVRKDPKFLPFPHFLLATYT